MESDGQVNRRKLGSIVFADPRERIALQAIVFPSIDRQIRESIARAKADPSVRFLVLDAASCKRPGGIRPVTV